MRPFVLDRSKWHRGQGGEGSCLLRPEDSKQCCVGLYLAACGVPVPEMLRISYVEGVRSLVPDEAKWLLAMPDEAKWLLATGAFPGDGPGTRLAVTNDSRNYDKVERERRIAELFRRHGDVEVTFVDQVEPK